MPGPATVDSFRAFSRALRGYVGQHTDCRVAPAHSQCVKTILLSVALALAAAGASAQTIYSKVSLDGHQTFSDRPAATPDPATEAEATVDARKARPRLSPLSPRRGAEIDAKEASRRLAQAQLKSRHGLAPRAGEQAEQVEGADSSVANRRYWQRQEKLRLAVEQAQRRLNETQRTQLAHR